MYITSLQLKAFTRPLVEQTHNLAQIKTTKLLILFGLPGAGKTFLGNALANTYNYVFYDGDENLPEEMKNALSKKLVISEAMRDRFVQAIINSLIQLQKKHSRVILAQTLLKDRHRREISAIFPHACFFLIHADNETRTKRILKRGSFWQDFAYVKKMQNAFEPPSVPHTIVFNTQEGTRCINQFFPALYYT